MSKIGAGMANNLMDLQDGTYDYELSILSDSIKTQLEASFECLALEGMIVYSTSIESLLEMAFANNHEFQRYFYHPDHLGSSSFITDATGEPTQHLEYLPFGELFIEERSTWNTPYKFSGKELDDETGYSYFGARYYDPNISIWLSVDPLSDEAPGWTPYRYAFNNPIRLIDPNGLFEDDPPKFIQPFAHSVDNARGSEQSVHIIGNPKAENIAFPSNGGTTSAGISVSAGYQGFDQKVGALKEDVDVPPLSNSTSIVCKSSKSSSLLFLEYEKSTETRQVLVTSDVLDPRTGKVLQENATFPVLVSERRESLSVGIGVFSAGTESREVYTYQGRASYQYRNEVGVSRGFKLGNSRNGSNIGVQGGINLRTDWKNVNR